MTPTATRQFFALPSDVQESVDAALERYALTGIGDVKSIKGSTAYRLRVGRYRVVFDEDRTTILAIYIGKRETTSYRKGRI